MTQPKTPAYTLDRLQEAINEAPLSKYGKRTGAKFVNIDTRVLEWLIADSRALAAMTSVDVMEVRP